MLAAIRTKEAAKANAEQRIVELTTKIDARAERFNRREWLVENKSHFTDLSERLDADPTTTRTLLRQLIVGFITVTPDPREDGAVAFTFAAEASFAGLPPDAWQEWPRTVLASSGGRRRRKGLYLPAESLEAEDTPDDSADGPPIQDGRLMNHLIRGDVTVRRVRRAPNSCPRGDSNTRHAV